MTYRRPLAASETFVPDPVDLPGQKSEEAGPSTLTRSGVLNIGEAGELLKAACSTCRSTHRSMQIVIPDERQLTNPSAPRRVVKP
jgi:hypothetical protein